MEPWAEITHRAYANGDVPLWNPYQATGAPHAANMQSAVFDPLLLAVNLHPTPLTWDISIIGAFVLGAAAAFVFGRVLGLGVVPAVVTSAAFSLNGWFFLYSNNAFSRSYVYLPLLFLLVEFVLRSRRLLPVLMLGVAVAGNLFVGMPEASFVVLGSTAAYAAARLVQERGRTGMRVSVARLGGAGLLGVMLAAPLLLLFFEYRSLSFNVHTSELAKGSETDPQWAMLNWLVPYFQSTPVSASVRSWFGAAVGVSALAAVSGRAETRRLHAWLFVALGAVVLLKVYEFRVFDWVGRLPVIELVIYPTFAPPVASFAFAVLAGIGVQVVWSRDLVLRRFLTIVAAAFVLLAIFVRTADRWSVITSVPRDYALAVWGRGVFFGAGAIAAILVSVWVARRWGPLLLAGLVVAELFVLAPLSIYAKRADPFLTPGWMPFVRAALAADPHGARVRARRQALPEHRGRARPAGHPRARRAVPRPLPTLRQDVRRAPHLRPVHRDRATRPVPGQPDVRRARHSRDRLAPEPGGSSRAPPHGADGDTRVYENTGAYPRAWVVHDVHVVDGEDQAFAFLRGRSRRRQGAYIVDRFDPRHEAVVEHGGKRDDEPRGLQAPPPAALREMETE